MKKIILLSIGVILVAIGTIGIFLPLLPTTPFLLLAATCFINSSDTAYKWLLNNKLYGEYVKSYIEKKGIPIRVKFFTLLLLWAGISYSFYVVDNIYARIFLVVVLIGVSTHIFLIKTKK